MRFLWIFATFCFCSSLLSADRLVFFCDFSDGFQPQVTAQPVDIEDQGAWIVDTGEGKALRYGRKSDGSLCNLIWRLKSSVHPEKISERDLPWPLHFGRMEFRFRAVDWQFGAPPPHTFLDMTGPLGSVLHFYYIRPNGDPGFQVAYGQYQNPDIGKGERTAYYPYVPLRETKNRWHKISFQWTPTTLTLTVDGKTVIDQLKYLATPRNPFLLDQLRIGFYSPVRLQGMTDITDIKFYSTMPEKKTDSQPRRFPELLVNSMKAPVIDGVLSDSEWGGVSRYTGFLRLPKGAADNHQPEARIGYDSRHLYIALKSTGHKRPPVSSKTHHDAELWLDDGIEVFLADKSRKNEYIQMIFNHAGVSFDQYFRPNIPLEQCHAWNCPGLRSASSIKGDTWTTEIAIPFAGLGRPAPAPGDQWYFNLCESLRGIGFFSMAAIKHSYSEYHNFGILNFAGGNAPVIDFPAIGGLFRGEAEFLCGIRKAPGSQMEINAKRYDQTAQMEFALFGTTAPLSSAPAVRFRANEDKLGKTGTLYANILDNGRRLYAGRFFYEVIREAEIENLRRVLVNGMPFLRIATAHLNDGKSRIRFSINDLKGKSLRIKTVPITGMKQDSMVELAGLPEGDYMLAAELLNEKNEVTQKAQARPFTVYPKILPWTGFIRKNIDTSHVPAPWTPLKMTRKQNSVTVECWNRTYTFGTRSFFAEQIVTAGMPCLAAPVDLILKKDGAAAPQGPIALRVLSAGDRRIVLETRGTLGGVLQASVKATIDYDGFIWYDLQLTNDNHNSMINQLSVRLEMPRSSSTLLNSGFRDLRNTGCTPRKWSKLLDTVVGPFWVGTEIGGLSFGIESGENWHNQDSGNQASVIRENGNAFISLNMIDCPAKMKNSLHYGFYVMPTPVRPRPKDYRRVRPDEWFAHNGNFRSGKGYHSNLSWWTTLYTYQGLPAWYTDLPSVHKHFGIDDSPRFNSIRDLYNVEYLRQGKSRSAWYATYSSIGRNAPEVIWNGEAWRSGQEDRLYGNTLYGYKYDMIEVCKTPDYNDFYLWRFDKSRREAVGIDGLYFDLWGAPACNRTEHNHGYVDEKGRRRETYPLREHRAWLEKIYIYCKEKADNAPIVMHMSGATSYIAGYVYADYILDGELWMDVLARDRSYKAMTLDQARAEILPHIWGPATIWLSELHVASGHVPASQRKGWALSPWAFRHIVAMLLIHDVVPDRFSQRDYAWKAWLALDRFGLADSDCYLPYWKDCGISGDSNGKDTAISAYLKKDAGKMMLVIFNNRDKDADSTVVMNTARIFGKDGTLAARDLEDGRALAVSGNKLVLPVGQRNFRLVEIRLAK